MDLSPSLPETDLSPDRAPSLSLDPSRSSPSGLDVAQDRPDLQVYAEAFNAGFATGPNADGQFQSPQTANARFSDLALVEGPDTAIAALPTLGAVQNADVIRGLQSTLDGRGPGTEAVLDGRLDPRIATQERIVLARGADMDDAVMVTFPNQRITVGGIGVPGIGHAGVLLIDDETGGTRYYEYGRYPDANGDPDSRGRAVQRTVPDAVIDPDTGRPTAESMRNIMESISLLGDPNGRAVKGAYFDDEINFNQAVNYAEAREAEGVNPDREAYRALDRNCAHFMRDVVVNGGGEGIPRFVLPTPILPTPNNYMSRVQSSLFAGQRNVNYDYRSDTLITNPLNPWDRP